MTLAIFDLDNTLLRGDSDHSFGDFLISKGLVDAVQHKARNDYFYQQYKNGGLDMVAYTEFVVSALKGMSRAQREALHRDYMRDFIEPMMLPAAEALLRTHRQRGDYCLIITATNRFITEPIAARLGVHALIATDLEIVDDIWYYGSWSGSLNIIFEISGGNSIVINLDGSTTYVNGSSYGGGYLFAIGNADGSTRPFHVKVWSC